MAKKYTLWLDKNDQWHLTWGGDKTRIKIEVDKKTMQIQLFNENN